MNNTIDESSLSMYVDQKLNNSKFTKRFYRNEELKPYMKANIDLSFPEVISSNREND